LQLIEGDCLEVLPTMADQSIDAIICDLPYGTTVCKWDAVIPFEPLWEQYKRVIKPKGAIVLFGSQPFTTSLISSNLKWFKYEWIWEKSRATGFLDCKLKPLNNYESVLVFCNGKTIYNPQMVKGKLHTNGRVGTGPAQVYGKFSDRKLSKTDLYYPKRIIKFTTEDGLHPTQKPVALLEYLIKTYTNEGDTVLDNCMGSGTTGAACRNIGRNFIGIEKDPGYFQVAKQRIET